MNIQDELSGLNQDILDGKTTPAEARERVESLGESRVKSALIGGEGINLGVLSALSRGEGGLYYNIAEKKISADIEGAEVELREIIHDELIRSFSHVDETFSFEQVAKLMHINAEKTSDGMSAGALFDVIQSVSGSEGVITHEAAAHLSAVILSRPVENLALFLDYLYAKDIPLDSSFATDMGPSGSGLGVMLGHSIPDVLMEKCSLELNWMVKTRNNQGLDGLDDDDIQDLHYLSTPVFALAKRENSIDFFSRMYHEGLEGSGADFEHSLIDGLVMIDQGFLDYAVPVKGEEIRLGHLEQIMRRMNHMNHLDPSWSLARRCITKEIVCVDDSRYTDENHRDKLVAEALQHDLLGALVIAASPELARRIDSQRFDAILEQHSDVVLDYQNDVGMKFSDDNTQDREEDEIDVPGVPF